MERLTFASSEVTTSLLVSSKLTVIVGAIDEPADVLVGSWVKANCVAVLRSTRRSRISTEETAEPMAAESGVPAWRARRARRLRVHFLGILFSLDDR